MFLSFFSLTTEVGKNMYKKKSSCSVSQSTHKGLDDKVIIPSANP